MYVCMYVMYAQTGLRETVVRYALVVPKHVLCLQCFRTMFRIKNLEEKCVSERASFSVWVLGRSEITISNGRLIFRWFPFSCVPGGSTLFC